MTKLPKYYCTSFCNKAHRMSDGKPVRHECRILPPAALKAELEGDYSQAMRIIGSEPRARFMRRGARQ